MASLFPMAIRPLSRDDWNDYSDAFSDKIEAGQVKRATVRLLSSDDGDQPLATDAALHGLTYDPKDNLLEIQMEGLDHLAMKPKEIRVDEDADTLTQFEVVREDGDKEIVEFG